MTLSLGIDFGTSGARAIVLDQEQVIQANVNLAYPANAAQSWVDTWQQTLETLIQQIPAPLRRQITTLAINGTSATVLFCDRQGVPISPPLLYNDPIGKPMLAQLATIVPPHHPVLSATSSLAKLLWWQEQYSSQEPVYQPSSEIRELLPNVIDPPKSPLKRGTLNSLRTPLFKGGRGDPLSIEYAPVYLLHQADWLAFLLHGQLGISDYHNALKLGYDVGTLSYPDWFTDLQLWVTLPQVLAPGSAIAEVQPQVADRLGLPRSCVVKAGTTDSIAAFLASGAKTIGEAVTSLGSTLVLKLLSDQRVDDARYGLYSHRLGDLWLVGGASNTGGAVLRQFFSDVELRSLSQQIPVDRPSPLDYYPLTQPGERFPINDPDLIPRLTPRPDNPAEFLHGLLESMARIEAQGYQRLQDLGATPLKQVYTAGGGAANETWTAIRQRHLQVPLLPPRHTEAAYGTALLANSVLN